MADELDMLRALIDDERVSNEDTKSFEDMKRILLRSSKNKLSRPQSQWVKDMYEKLELDAGDSANLFSTGKVKADPREKGVVLPWEKPGYVKPLRPPGRK